MKKQFAVIGIGRFGSSVAQSLHAFGFEVLAVDSNEQRVQAISSSVTQAIQADSTDEEALRAIGIDRFDVVVVAIGTHIQASILTCLILKDLGVPKLIVKAQNDLQAKVLSKIGADKVIFPERDMGHRVAHHLISPSVMDFIELSDGYSIVELQAAPQMIGKSLKQLDIRAKYQCNVIAVKNDGVLNITPSADALIRATDTLVVVGKNEHVLEFEKIFAR